MFAEKRFGVFLALSFAILLILFNAVQRFDTFQPLHTAYFGGDEWEYQSIGVNLAKGHGFPIFGAAEPFDAYRFGSVRGSSNYAPFVSGTRYDFYRSPAYPLMLAGVYALFGVDPYVAKTIQYWMLVVSLCVLPFVGFAYWGYSGILGATLGALLSFDAVLPFAGHLITETLIVFCLSLLMVVLTWLDRKPTVASAACAGAACGLALLVKGSLIFFPVAVTAWLIVRCLTRRCQARVSLVFLLVAALPVVLYSVWATEVSGHFVFVSTQGQAVLLDGNNELALKTGEWEPGWRSDPSAFFNDPVIRDESATRKTLAFLMLHAQQVPALLLNKLTSAFGSFSESWLLLTVFLVFVGLSIRREDVAGCYRRYAAGVAMVLALLAISTGGWSSGWAPESMFRISVLVVPSTLACLALVALRSVVGAFRRFCPLPVASGVINYVLLSLILFGHDRFVVVFLPEIKMVWWVMLLGLVAWLASRWPLRELAANRGRPGGLQIAFPGSSRGND